MSEHDEQVALFDVLRANETKHPELRWIFAIPNGGSRHPAVAAKLKAEGVKRGISDICVPIARHGFHGLYIEMKVKPNRLTPEQAEFHDFVHAEGYATYTAFSAVAAQTCIEVYLGLKLER